LVLIETVVTRNFQKVENGPIYFKASILISAMSHCAFQQLLGQLLKLLIRKKKIVSLFGAPPPPKTATKAAFMPSETAFLVKVTAF
jgi:hypothetical protein